jgi:catechol-2,3-dioxygenase
MIAVRRLNHAVLFVSELEPAAAFYQNVFGMDVIARQDPMAFLRVKGSTNHHDLGLLALGAGAPRPPAGTTGLYHLAWEVGSIQELADAKQELLKAGALRGESDHGATKSLYGEDPDGNEFEVMTLLPRDQWGEYEHHAVVKPLRWEEELRKATKGR